MGAAGVLIKSGKVAGKLIGKKMGAAGGMKAAGAKAVVAKSTVVKSAALPGIKVATHGGVPIAYKALWAKPTIGKAFVVAAKSSAVKGAIITGKVVGYGAVAMLAGFLAETFF